MRRKHPAQHCGVVPVGHFELGVRKGKPAATFGQANGAYAPLTSAFLHGHSQAALPPRAQAPQSYSPRLILA